MSYCFKNTLHQVKILQSINSVLLHHAPEEKDHYVDWLLKYHIDRQKNLAVVLTRNEIISSPDLFAHLLNTYQLPCKNIFTSQEKLLEILMQQSPIRKRQNIA